MIDKIFLLSLVVVSAVMQTAYANKDFKKHSVSIGWIHIMPQGKANPFNINTVIKDDQKYKIGSIGVQTFKNSIDRSKVPETGVVLKESDQQLRAPVIAPRLKMLENLLVIFGSRVPEHVSGQAQLNGLEAWHVENSGLEAKRSDTFGLMYTYNFDEHISFQVKAGIPPKVKIKGVGQIDVNTTGIAYPESYFNKVTVPLKERKIITNFELEKSVSEVRSWTPAFEVQYVFGMPNENKLRPFVGLGVLYAKFTHIKLNANTKNDLIAAGHMIQNVVDGKVGNAVENVKKSSADIKVKAKSSDEIAPIITLGVNYDITDSIFATASISYSKLNTRTDIVTKNMVNNETLVQSSTRLDIDPVVTYLGVGYRF